MSQFVLDYMHLVCLGVVKRLINLWVPMRGSGLLSIQIASAISKNLVFLKKSMPGEFSRKPQSLFEFRLWKATEFKQFLLYTGPVVLKDKISPAMYKNFLYLSISIRILLKNDSSTEWYDYAENLFKCFVQGIPKIYGNEQLAYNVHSLIHLTDDARKFGSLNNISYFPFENYLGQLKRVVRRPQSPISQIIRRYREKIRTAELFSADNTFTTKHKQKHNKGPLPLSHSYCDQYKKYLGTFLISTNEPDNCFEVKGKIRIVENILLDSAGNTFLVVQNFSRKANFFESLLYSSKLNIWVVSLLNTSFVIVSLDAVVCKMILLPHKDIKIAIQLVHTDKGKFKKY